MRKKHGHASRQKRSGTYMTWSAMIQRCKNPNNTKYPKYGALGIKVCERWEIFENFLADMGERPAGKTLDRWPDQSGNYEPSNCRWATPLQQQRNLRTNVFVEYMGERLCIPDWSKRFDINEKTLRHRLAKGKIGAELFRPSQRALKKA
jgi:hypothetical protein